MSTRAWANIGAVLAAFVFVGADCDTCPPMELPQPMTELRAREIDPSLVEGFGVSTTWIAGDCRPDTRQKLVEGCTIKDDPRCLNERTSMRVLLLPTNLSLPQTAECGAAFPVEELAKVAVVDARSNEVGELVAAAPAGRYSLFISRDDRCATCGLVDAGIGCLIDIPRGAVVARDLVLDEAAH